VLHPIKRSIAYALVLGISSFSPKTFALVEPVPNQSAHTLALPEVVHVRGLGDISLLSKGDLHVEKDKLWFTSQGAREEVALSTVRSFSIEHDTVPLMRGMKGQLAGAAPYGVGEAFKMVRTAVDTLTFVYTDNNQGMHGAVLLLPKGTGASAADILTQSGIKQESYLRGETQFSLDQTKEPVAPETDSAVHKSRSIEVQLPTKSIEGVPDGFPVAVYEELLAELVKSGQFEHVWRQGDIRSRESHPYILRISVDGFKLGNPRKRAIMPLMGASQIKAKVQCLNSAETTLLDTNLTGTVRMKPENMDVTHDLCKKIKKSLLSMPAFRNNPSANPQS
jgi:hypothetical protein